MPMQIHGRIANERSRIIARLHKQIVREQIQRFIGCEYDAWVTEKRKDYLAHTDSYLQIIIAADTAGGEDGKNHQNLLGKKVRVRITDSGTYYLRGMVLEILEDAMGEDPRNEAPPRFEKNTSAIIVRI